MFSVPAVGVRFSLFAFPMVIVPEETLSKPERLIPALKFIMAVDEFNHIPLLVASVVRAVNGTKVPALGVDSLNVPLVKVKKLLITVKEELETSKILLADVPILRVIRLKRVNAPVPLMV